MSLDVLRGATIAAMVLVNDPAMGPPYLYHQLTHSPWNGWTFADTIFPTFLFMVGASMAPAMARYVEGRAPRRAALTRIIRRAGLLFLLGLLVNGFPLLLDGGHGLAAHLRVPGVLQRIAIAYLLASLAVLYLRPRYQALLAGALLGGYWAALSWVSVPGYGAGVLSPQGNLAAWVDRAVFGSAHMYGGGVPGYDPEGLLGSVVAVAGVLAGYWAGRLLRSGRSRLVTTGLMVACATACVGAADLWASVLPVNKRMWTPSYVLLMTGLALGALALAHLLFDQDHLVARITSLPLRVLGTNALLVYIGSELTAAALGHYHHALGDIANAPIPFFVWAHYLVPRFGPVAGALVYACAILGAWWLVLGGLFRRGLFLRI
ncbi:MAG TPA: DUF5009 domain-containing protein [Acidimicrobiales bacterium]|nr:DUF5009 domain-containing protein [Acidimicrobiales bacterium]